MPSRTAALPAVGPAIDDVSRLWSHLTTEWVSDLQLRIYPHDSSGGRSIVQVSLESPRFVGDKREPVMYVWAAKEFSQSGYMISWGQLYDLLIVGYRAIEAELRPAIRQT